ncbi:MAG: 2-polyprenylphenol 6-hydroxylase [Rickettsia sp.]|nr:2-polyprenylphenol 6-hydroxylase [Rickettsia sp.]
MPHSFFFNSKMKLEERVQNFIYEMGPIFIKFAQTLSTSPDIVGPRMSHILSLVQDKLPSFGKEIFVKKFQGNFNLKIEDVFEYFDYETVSSASVAQVYKAKLKTGEDVAVKCLRPNILKRYRQDIVFLEYLYKIFSKIFSNIRQKSQRLKLQEVLNLFQTIMYKELDLKQEAYSASKIRNNFMDDDDVYIPKIYPQFVSTEILVLEWVEGFSVYDHDNISKAGLNLQDIVYKFVRTFFNQAYRDGFFHADPHPGNILISKFGQIIILDFGIVSAIEEKDRLAVAEILYAFLQRDYLLVAKIHRNVGYIPQDVNLELFADACRKIAEPMIDKEGFEFSIDKLLYNLFKITEDFGMQTQIQLLMLQKTLVMVEGVSRILGAQTNIWYLIKPHIKKWALKNISFEAKLVKIFKECLKKLF